MAADGTLALIGTVDVKSNDVRSVAVPIVPKRIGVIKIKVSAIFQIKLGNTYQNAGSETVERELLIVVSSFFMQINVKL